MVFRIMGFKLLCHTIAVLGFLFVSSHIFGQYSVRAEGEYLVLPEIVLPVIDKKFISQPDNFRDVSEQWVPELPRFRREYYLNIDLVPLEIEIIRPEIESMNFWEEILLVSHNYILDEEDERSYQRKSLSGELNLVFQDGLSIEARTSGLSGHELQLKLITPPSETLFSGQEISWSFNCIVNAGVTFGLKPNNTNYSLGEFSWTSQDIMPTSIDVHAQIYNWDSFVGLFAGNLDYNLRLAHSDWFLRFGGSGLVHGVDDAFSFSGGGHLGASWDNPENGLRLSLAARVAYSFLNNSVLPLPIIDLNWFFIDGWSLYVSTIIQNFYSGRELNTVRYRTITNTGEVFPNFNTYISGISGNPGDVLAFDAFLVLREGNILYYDRYQKKLISQNDLRLGAGFAMDFVLNTATVTFDSNLEFSLNKLPEQWEIEIGYNYESFLFFLAGGSENLLIFDTLGDLLHNNLYTGLGFAMYIGKSLLNTAVYIPLEEDISNFVIKIGWELP